jgi:hypothetical protein
MGAFYGVVSMMVILRQVSRGDTANSTAVMLKLNDNVPSRTI